MLWAVWSRTEVYFTLNQTSGLCLSVLDCPWIIKDRLTNKTISPFWNKEQIYLWSIPFLSTAAACLVHDPQKSTSVCCFQLHLIYISLLIIPCIIYYVTNKETLNLEPWTHENHLCWVGHLSRHAFKPETYGSIINIRKEELKLHVEQTMKVQTWCSLISISAYSIIISVKNCFDHSNTLHLNIFL